jgi:hypothetical protein
MDGDGFGRELCRAQPDVSHDSRGELHRPNRDDIADTDITDTDITDTDIAITRIANTHIAESVDLSTRRESQRLMMSL